MLGAMMNGGGSEGAIALACSAQERLRRAGVTIAAVLWPVSVALWPVPVAFGSASWVVADALCDSCWEVKIATDSGAVSCCAHGWVCPRNERGT